MTEDGVFRDKRIEINEDDKSITIKIAGTSSYLVEDSFRGFSHLETVRKRNFINFFVLPYTLLVVVSLSFGRIIDMSGLIFLYFIFFLIYIYDRNSKLDTNDSLETWNHGHERICIFKEKISIHRQAENWSAKDDYSVNSIEAIILPRRIKAYEEYEFTNAGQQKWHHPGYGRIHIKVGRKTVAFAMDVRREDAEIILDRIARKFPHYVPDRKPS